MFYLYETFVGYTWAPRIIGVSHTYFGNNAVSWNGDYMTYKSSGFNTDTSDYFGIID